MEDKKKNNQKIMHFLNFFSGDATLTDKNKNTYSRAIKFEQIMDIYNSELGTLRKIAALNKVFKSYDQLVATYSDLEENKDNLAVAPFYEMFKKISTFYKVCEENGLVEVANGLLKLEDGKYFEDFNYAKDFIIDYINYNDSPYTYDFLKEVGLTEGTFSRFVEIVFELDQDLYEKYLQKVNLNKSLRVNEVKERVANIKSGVITGKLLNGEEFDKLSFYANFPFYKEELSKEILSDFGCRNTAYIDQKFKSILQSVSPESSYEIIKFVYDNKFLTSTSPTISEKIIQDTNYIVKGREVTSDEKEKIINYMKTNRITWLAIAFQEVRDRYLDGTLDLDSGKKLVK